MFGERSFMEMSIFLGGGPWVVIDKKTERGGQNYRDKLRAPHPAPSEEFTGPPQKKRHLSRRNLRGRGDGLVCAVSGC